MPRANLQYVESCALCSMFQYVCTMCTENMLYELLVCWFEHSFVRCSRLSTCRTSYTYRARSNSIFPSPTCLAVVAIVAIAVAATVATATEVLPNVNMTINYSSRAHCVQCMPYVLCARAAFAKMCIHPQTITISHHHHRRYRHKMRIHTCARSCRRMVVTVVRRAAEQFQSGRAALRQQRRRRPRTLPVCSAYSRRYCLTGAAVRA